MSELDDLERRVGEKFMAAAVELTPEWPHNVEMGTWQPMAAPALQLPREQWVIYPSRRMVALLIIDRMLDFDSLTDEQWGQVAFLYQYGGRERVA